MKTPKEILEKNKRYRDANDDKIRKYRVDHAEEIKARHHRWYLKNKEARLEKGREWKEKNPDKMDAWYQKYYAEHEEQRQAEYLKKRLVLWEQVKTWKDTDPEKWENWLRLKNSIKWVKKYDKEYWSTGVIQTWERGDRAKRRAKKNAHTRERYNKCPEKYKEKDKSKRKKRRLMVLSHYSDGRPKCVCCGETNIGFLSLNHINGGGYKHRKEEGISDMCAWVIRNDYPEGFNVLCYNCNSGEGRCGGTCPHKLENKEMWHKKSNTPSFERANLKRIEMKYTVLSHYSAGSAKCACCGEQNINFLTVHHKHGDGAEHRKKLRNGKSGVGGGQIYPWLVRNGFPDGYEVLCYNCNCGISWSGAGVCPHKL